MATLKELYTTLKSLRDMNLPVDDKLLAAADSLEEKIIKEEILPSLSQNIEPQLSEIHLQRSVWQAQGRCHGWYVHA